MRKSVKTFLTACAMAASVAVSAQDSIVNKFDSYRRSVLQEKMFVHTDRNTYLTGETIWLKIYTTDATLHKLSDISKVAYVEILDSDQTPVLQEKIALSNGVGKGSVFLAASLSSGNYTLRAYTNWMKNFPSDYFFNKQIMIVNSFIKLDGPSKPGVAQLDAQFFPEGGQLLAGVSSKVGVKVTNKGASVSYHGSVFDEAGDTVARFKDLKFGMTSFEFTPAVGKKYSAIVKSSGASTVTALPSVLSEGYSMKVTSSSDNLNVEVNYLPASQDGPSVFLFAHSRELIVKAEKKRTQQGKAYFEIPLTDLKAGVTVLTLFNEARKPVAERLYFNKPSSTLDLSLTSGLTDYRTRAKVSFELTANKPAKEMSVAVYRMDSISSNEQEVHFPEHLLLTSELRGRVESPWFYMSSDPDAATAADNLMLTQGWRRFSWDKVLGGKPMFEFAPEHHGHIINGVVQGPDGQSAQQQLTYLTVPGKIIDVYGSRSDAQGRVSYELKHFFGEDKVLTYADSSFKVQLTSPFSSQPAPAVTQFINPSNTSERNILARSVGMQVQNTYYEDHFSFPKVDSSAFYGKADETYLLDDYTRFPVMEEVMREYVPGVLVRKHRDGFHFYLLDVVNKKALNDQPMILLDGVPIFDVNKIIAFDPLRVKKLEVVTRKFYHGLLTFPGIVSYSTYEGDLAGFELDKKYVELNYKGLQLNREFYSPRHESEKEAEMHLPDQRSLLYWDPSLSVSTDGKQVIPFYTSDVPGTYRVVVEGLSDDGTPGYVSKTFTVRK